MPIEESALRLQPWPPPHRRLATAMSRARRLDLVVLWGTLFGWINGIALDEPTELSAFTVAFSIHSQWLKESGAVQQDEKIEVSVGIGVTTVLIQSRRAGENSNFVFFTWGNIAERPNEWVFAMSAAIPGGLLNTVLLDNHPTHASPDLYSNLGRILCIPEDHPALAGAPREALLYLAGESGGYRPEELRYEVTSVGGQDRRLPARTIAWTPEYFYDASGKRRRFGGSNRARTLWDLTITGYTNWQGQEVPCAFIYKRYQDPDLRHGDVPDVPIVLCRGTLTAIEPGADVDLTAKLERELKVMDYRRRELGGAPVVYQSGYGHWPAIDSPEFKHIVRTNVAVAQAAHYRSQPSIRRAVVFSLIGCTILVPAVAFLFWLRGSVKAKTHQPQEQREKNNENETT